MCKFKDPTHQASPGQSPDPAGVPATSEPLPRLLRADSLAAPAQGREPACSLLGREKPGSVPASQSNQGPGKCADSPEGPSTCHPGKQVLHMGHEGWCTHSVTPWGHCPAQGLEAWPEPHSTGDPPGYQGKEQGVHLTASALSAPSPFTFQKYQVTALTPGRLKRPGARPPGGQQAAPAGPEIPPSLVASAVTSFLHGAGRGVCQPPPGAVVGTERHPG